MNFDQSLDTSPSATADYTTTTTAVYASGRAANILSPATASYGQSDDIDAALGQNVARITRRTRD